MTDFDPKTDILNNAINEEGWQILDVRNDDELQNDGNLRDQVRFQWMHSPDLFLYLDYSLINICFDWTLKGAKNWVHIPKPDVETAVSNGTFEVYKSFGSTE